jgi:acetyltransferase-like isoleucine patch superfamily enzyme
MLAVFDRMRGALRHFLGMPTANAPSDDQHRVDPEASSRFMSKNAAYSQYSIGDWTYGQPTIRAWDARTSLKIGKFCSIAAGVTILLGGEHRVDWVSTYPFNILFDAAAGYRGHPHTKGDVRIGNDVWIGLESVILSGVTIADGAVIAARSVVTKDVPAYAIVAGNPARFVRFRFPEAIVAQLVQIAWWDWPIDKIQEAWPLLLSPNVDAFVEKYSIGHA